MKNLKKLASAILALSLVMALMLPVGAAGETGTITVNNNNAGASINGQTFKAYKIFDVTYNSTGDAYSYLPAPQFKTFVESTYTVGQIAAWDDNSSELNAFAAALHSYIVTNGIDADATATGGATETAEFTGLELGYYIVLGGGTVDGKDGNETITSLCMLTTTNPEAEVTIKLDVPTVDKQVQEDSDGVWGNVADYDIGENVPFRVTSKVPEMNGFNRYKFVFHDTMSAGLSFNANSLVVKVGNDNAVYTLVTDTTDGCTFHIELALKADGENLYESGKDIVIEYTAQLTADAEIYGGKEDNKVHLEYSNNPYDGNETGKTPDEEVDVYTYEFDVFKYTGDDKKPLAGAEFALYRDIVTDEGENKGKPVGDPIQFVLANGIYRVATPAEIANASIPTTETLVSPENGLINVQGLDADTYYLFETKAPDGYNPIDEAREIVINEIGSDGSWVKGTTEVLNNSGTVFPETGGIGRTIFTVAGVCLMLGAAVVLIARRKVTSK